MNLYEVSVHGTESIYLLAPTKYRALESRGRLHGRCRLVGHDAVRQHCGAAVGSIGRADTPSRKVPRVLAERVGSRLVRASELLEDGAYLTGEHRRQQP
jgi:hypothetical protein